MRTEGQTKMTKLIETFGNYANESRTVRNVGTSQRFSHELAWLGLINASAILAVNTDNAVGVHTVGYATTNYITTYESYNEQFFSINSGCYNEHKWTRRNTTSRRITRVRITCRAFPLWLERQSPYLLSFVRFSYQFSSVICLFVQCIKVK
jgi:hypothetical protein